MLRARFVIRADFVSVHGSASYVLFLLKGVVINTVGHSIHNLIALVVEAIERDDIICMVSKAKSRIASLCLFYAIENLYKTLFCVFGQASFPQGAP